MHRRSTCAKNCATRNCEQELPTMGPRACAGFCCGAGWRDRGSRRARKETSCAATTPPVQKRRSSAHPAGQTENIRVGSQSSTAIPQIGSSGVCKCLSGIRVSCATANSPSRRHRSEKLPVEQSIVLTYCDLIRQRKRTRPCNDCPTSSLDTILRVVQTVV